MHDDNSYIGTVKIISKLWSIIYDLLFYIDGNSIKSFEQIHNELDIVEYMCRPYVDYDIYIFGEENEQKE
jgi:hypothetical protein